MKEQIDRLMNFFNADLIEEYSSAWRKVGYSYLTARDYSKAQDAFYRSLYLKSIVPTVYYHIAYMYLDQQDYNRARDMYIVAVKRYEEYLALARQYHSLPDLVTSIKNEFAHVNLHLGVTEEKLGNIDAARQSFEKAIAVNPSFSQAYFNLATLYWKQSDWQTVVYYLKEAVRYDPQNMQFKQYLAQAQEKLNNIKN